MTNLFQRIVTALCAAGLWLAGLSLLAMILLVSADIVGRWLFGFSLLIADEYSGYFLIAMTFLGGAFALQSGSFTRMDVLYKRTRGRGRLIVELFINLVALVYLSVIDYSLWAFIGSSIRSGVTSISIAQTPLYIPRLFMGIGVTMLVLVTLLEMVLLFRSAAGAEKATDS
jgi:TRAP-type C4-dicarboxylate transport system permease small subunit